MCHVRSFLGRGDQVHLRAVRLLDAPEIDQVLRERERGRIARQRPVVIDCALSGRARAKSAKRRAKTREQWLSSSPSVASLPGIVGARADERRFDEVLWPAADRRPHRHGRGPRVVHALVRVNDRVDNLDLVRAVAILLVLGFHAVQQANGATGWATSGQFGVDLFFALSGYLIGTLYWQEIERFGHVLPARFIARRALRTVPPYLIGLALSFAAAHQYRGAPFDVRYLLFTQNYEPTLPYFTVSWSLCIEEHFYLALPLLLGLVTRWDRRYAPILLIGAAVLSLVARALVMAGLTRPYPMYATHLRLDGLAIGVLAAYAATYHRDRFARLARARWVAAALSVLALTVLLALPHALVFVVGFTALALTCGLVVSVAATDRPWGPARWRLTRTIALTSYSIYLTHPLAIQAVARFARVLPTSALVAAMLLASVAVGVLFHRLVEVPAIRARDWLVPRRREGQHHVALPSLPVVGAG
jgi:peptidoglycan/LPS O-acetylase OafA/YrhL